METRSSSGAHAAWLFVLAGAMSCALAAGAHAQTVITSLPATITVPGNYVLKSNLTYASGSGAAITIATYLVTIDFQGYGITGTADSATRAIGIRATDQILTTIKNGALAGFYRGIVFDATSANSNAVNFIENMRISFITDSGIRISNGSGGWIENCQVTNIGGRPPADPPGSPVAGIVADGMMTVRNNHVSIVTPDPGSISFGIQAFECLIVGNQVDNCTDGIYASYGSKYQYNLTSGCTHPVAAGIDAGHNN